MECRRVYAKQQADAAPDAEAPEGESASSGSDDENTIEGEYREV